MVKKEAVADLEDKTQSLLRHGYSEDEALAILLTEDYAKKDIIQAIANVKMAEEEYAEERVKASKAKGSISEKAESPEANLEKKVKNLFDEGYDAGEILTGLLSIGHDEKLLKKIIIRVKEGQKRKKTERKEKIPVENVPQIKTAIDDIYFIIEKEKKITIAELADRVRFSRERLKKWLEYLEKEGLIKIKCKFFGPEIIELTEGL